MDPLLDSSAPSVWGVRDAPNGRKAPHVICYLPNMELLAGANSKNIPLLLFSQPQYSDYCWLLFRFDNNYHQDSKEFWGYHYGRKQHYTTSWF